MKQVSEETLENIREAAEKATGKSSSLTFDLHTVYNITVFLI